MKALKKLSLLFVVASVAVAVASCGGDENNGGPTEDPDSGEQPDTGMIDPDGGGDGGGPTSFPAYVQDLVTTKTSETAAPDTEMVWGMLQDNEGYVFPATFFQ